MKKIISKFMASIIASSMLAVSVGTISASAITPSIVPGSEFDYEVSVEKVSGYTNRYKLSINSINNPGFCILGMSVTYDSNCVPLSYTKSPWLNVGMGDEISTIFMAAGSDNHYDFTVELNFTINGDAAADHEFEVGVYRYKSDSENLNKGDESYKGVAVDAAFGIKEGMVGDLDGDDGIGLNDAYLVKTILSEVQAVSTTTAKLNAHLKDNRADLISGGKYLGLVNNAYISAAIADTNGDDIIDYDDSNEILLYYTHASVGSSYASDYLGKVPSVKIVC
ncbi:hypothetical protein [Ruminococcus sp.]|uniref:hypothetical protein n=1 Tax=Ruminococcus sp. TaxID=41978 RepID=UPI002600C790|nr:hypothetical protein [Ruminococcus sp.]